MASHPRHPLIRVAVLDRHPAFRFGVDALLKAELDVLPVGAAGDTRDLWPLLQRVDPDVVLVDHQPGWSDRLALVQRITARFRAHVLITSAGPDPELAIPARLAGARAIADKTDDPRTLVDAIRCV